MGTLLVHSCVQQVRKSFRIPDGVNVEVLDAEGFVVLEFEGNGDFVMNDCE